MVGFFSAVCYCLTQGRKVDTSIDYIYGFVGDSTYFMNKNVVVVDNAEFIVSDIVITGSRVLENNGIINSDIDVCENCVLEIYNRGRFNADFNLQNNASIVQVVSQSSDLNKIDFNVDYSVRVDNADGIKLSDIIRIGANAKEVLVRDSFVVWDVYDIGMLEIKLNGDIRLEIQDVESVIKRPLLYDVSPYARVRVVSSAGLNPMFEVNTYVENDNLYAHLVREQDYTRFMDYNVGSFINSLRDDSSAIGLLNALDGAMSINDINKIMADSMRLVPINMMNTVAMLNSFDVNNWDYKSAIGPSYIKVGDSDAYGAFVNTNVDVGNIKIGARGYVNSLNLNDSFDSYSGVMYGGNIYAEYGCDFNFARGIVGGNITHFDITNVFDGVRGVDNPTGYSMYGVIDIGRRFDFENGIFIAPYVGMGTNYMTILRANDSVVAGRVGIDVAYDFEMFGINYDYGIRAMINTDNEIIIGGRARFVSDIDMVGGHIAIDYTDNETGRGYKITAGMNFMF